MAYSFQMIDVVVMLIKEGSFVIHRVLVQMLKMILYSKGLLLENVYLR